jgi:hypothetical protein
MRKSMRKLAIACIAAYAALGGIGVANAQMHGGGGFHGGGFHGSGESHGGDGVHGGHRFHHDGGFHGRSVFVSPPIIFGPGYYPYGYSAPYDFSYPYGDDSGSIYWYCGDPAGYYPDVQTCPGGWLQVVPNG